MTREDPREYMFKDAGRGRRQDRLAGACVLPDAQSVSPGPEDAPTQPCFRDDIANQTFNTGQEPAKSFTGTFQSDPLKRGWYFDFDLLGIGREVNAGFLPAMNPDSVGYNWVSRCAWTIPRPPP
jgi:hypothetical protein